ncbi:MAG TPA: ATP-binding cassette domain-containing protein [Blastocatellia bacterium]|nr:ATP-binding cassette domain-containing protein [Blastocatellia bacterium]
MSSAVDSSAPALEFRGVSVSFEDRFTLDNVSFKLDRGQMIVITGNSGSGKSVLLHLAIGLLQPDQGEIFIDGRKINSLTETELLDIRSRRMGLVFQEDTLFTALDVYENTAYRLVEHNLPEDEIDPAVMEILRFVGLEEDTEKLPEELSIGMRRRLELARALVGWPSIMLFDEPTSGLDPINSRQVLDLIIRARDVHDISSLLVTKELHQIPYLVSHHAAELPNEEVAILEGEGGRASQTKVMVLEDGRIVFTGTSAEFESSTLPSVLKLTHPETGTRRESSNNPDPWSKKLKPKEPLF